MLLLALLVLGLASGAQGASIDVQISHRDSGDSGDADGAANLQVKLLGLTPDGDTIAHESQSDLRGRARFSDLPTPGAYLVMVEYQGIGFHADGVRFMPEDEPQANRQTK